MKTYLLLSIFLSSEIYQQKYYAVQTILVIHFKLHKILFQFKYVALYFITKSVEKKKKVSVESTEYFINHVFFFFE